MGGMPLPTANHRGTSRHPMKEILRCADPSEVGAHFSLTHLSRSQHRGVMLMQLGRDGV